METSSGSDSWLTAEMLEPLADVNVHCLELIRQRVRTADPQTLPGVLGALAVSWSNLSDTAIARIANVPYVLVETRFMDRGGSTAREVREVRDQGEFFAPEELPLLMREIVLLAWHFARMRRSLARVMLGMDASRVDAVAHCSLRELERLASGSTLALVLRWSDRPEVWKQALSAASSGNDEALMRVKLRGLQLLAAQSWPGPRE